MATDGNLEKLKTARDLMAKVYENEAVDEFHDNGNLVNIHKAIISVENAIQIIQKRQ